MIRVLTIPSTHRAHENIEQDVYDFMLDEGMVSEPVTIKLVSAELVGENMYEVTVEVDEGTRR